MCAAVLLYIISSACMFYYYIIETFYHPMLMLNIIAVNAMQQYMHVHEKFVTIIIADVEFV